MLLITRRAGERLLIGDNITIQVLEVVGTTVRLGIDAPPEVRIYREELWEAIKRENAEAASASPQELPVLRPPR